jgi:hypothetical protein
MTFPPYLVLFLVFWIKYFILLSFPFSPLSAKFAIEQHRFSLRSRAMPHHSGAIFIRQLS